MAPRAPVAVICMLLASNAEAAGNLDGLQVDLGYAKYNGVADASQDTNTFYGLRYAAAPVGDLRWRKPKAIEDVVHLSYNAINATTRGPQCIQGVPAWQDPVFEQIQNGLMPTSNVPPASEDCLLLDVITPSETNSTSLPVLVQIHGGGYVAGNSESLDGHALVAYSQNIISVQIQYRLGAYGFLGGDAIENDGAANVGLLDQCLALEWVQRHIQAFGGDPRRVTILGGSAGGGSVTDQMVLHGGQEDPPFRAAIAEYPYWQPFHDTDLLNSQYNELLRASGVGDIQGLRGLDETALADAYNVTFSSAYAKGLYAYGDYYYGPYVDGDVIRDLPSRSFANGQFSKVPLLTDHNEFEGVQFTNSSITTQAQARSSLSRHFPKATESFFNRLAQVYPLKHFTGDYFTTQNNFFQTPIFAQFAPPLGWDIGKSEFWRLQAEWAEFAIKCPTYYVGQAVAKARKPVFKLIFNSGVYIHAAVSLDLITPSAAAANSTQADIIKAYYVSFVTDLDPNKADLTQRPSFPPYTLEQPEVLRVNDSSIRTIHDPDASDICEFWWDQSDLVYN